MTGSITQSLLADSIDSLSSSRTLRSPSKATSSLISRTYKQASNLFLTRRLPECLQALEPIINPPESATDEERHDLTEFTEPAPIANASKSTRVKVWNLYTTLLSALVELGPENGKARLGNSQWRTLVASVRDGTVWEKVVEDGYHGREGMVDPDVVSNIATLLLAHCPSQEANQHRLESYLARSSEPMLDFSDRFEMSSHFSTDYHSASSNVNGTNTPRDLNSRLKVVELYALHVLPRNEEWDCAYEFLIHNELLDEDRREAFLQTLQSLKDQKRADEDCDAELQRLRDQQIEQERTAAKKIQAEERPRARQDESDSKIQHKRSGSEVDYGIEDQSPTDFPKKLQHSKITKPNQCSTRSAKISSVTRRSQGTKRSASINNKRGTSLIDVFQGLVTSAARSMSGNPRILLRTLLFLVALLLALSRRDVRHWLTRITGIGWDRLKRTVGMGVKVSYI